MKTYNYILTVSDSETDEKICHIEALSLEALEEQLIKTEHAISAYELAQKEEVNEEELS